MTATTTGTTQTVKKGDRFVAYPAHRPAERVFITINRVARDQSWVDCTCCTWAVLWTKRIPTFNLLAISERRHWDQIDLNDQQIDHENKLAERKGGRR